jgi:hypothetical protein
MPIEIRELVIKARVENNPPSTRQNFPAQQEPGDRDLQKIIDKCVEEVMKIIKKQKER